MEKSFIFYCEKSKNYRKEIDFLEKTEKDVTIKNGEKMKNNSVFK